jgi:hypothetical protein
LRVGFLGFRIVIPFQYDVAVTIRADVFASGALEMTSAKAVGDEHGMFEHGKVLQLVLKWPALFALSD